MRRAPLTQTELTRYLKAYRDAGIPVVRSEISRDGKVVIYSIEKQTDEVNNLWDRQRRFPARRPISTSTGNGAGDSGKMGFGGVGERIRVGGLCSAL